MSNEIQWFWIGNTKNSKFTNWDSGEPDNRDNNENCVAIFRAHDGRWHDRNCDDKIHAICAIRATSSIPRRPQVINHAVSSTSFGGSCQVTCLENSCQVRTGGNMGSCFLPPFNGGCGGLPSGCGSCIDECSYIG